MPEMKTIRFPGHSEPFEVVDARAREQLKALRAVSYEMFGAVLDGVADDTDAVIAAHEYANANGCRVEQHTGTAYLKTATADHCPVVKTDCDWSGMTFVVTEAMAKNVILRAEPDEGIRTISLSSAQIGQLAQGAISIPFLAEYPNCICHFTTDIVQPVRLNHADTTYVYHETVTSDRHGNLIDGGLFRDMTGAGSVTMEYQSIFERPIELRGARVLLDTTDDSRIPTFLIKRSNATLRDWTFEIAAQTSVNSTDYKGEILRIENAYNVTAEKLTGENFGTFFTDTAASRSQTCYAIYLSGLSRFTLRDCVLLRAWGVMQSQYCKDIAVRDSTLGRIDNHYGCRNYTISNVTLATSHSCINIGYGDGQFVIDNVRFHKFPDPDTTASNACVMLRRDFCALYSGELVIRNVSVSNHTGSLVNLLDGRYSDTWDYGDTSAVLPLAFPAVTIDGVVYDTDDVYAICFEVKEDSYVAANSLPITAHTVHIDNVRLTGDAQHLRVTMHYAYYDGLTAATKYPLRLRVPCKCNWIFGVSVDVFARDSHINSFNGTSGAALSLSDCYVYGYATTWEYVRDLALNNCHIYIGSQGTVRLNANHSLRMTDCIFEERATKGIFTALDMPDLYVLRGNYCITSTLDDALASLLTDSNTISNAGVMAKSAQLTSGVSATITTDELTAGADVAFEWTKYLMLAITTGDYSNIRECTIVPTSEFAETTASRRAILSWGNSRVDVYQVDESTIHAVGSSLNDNQRCRIFGLIKTA